MSNDVEVIIEVQKDEVIMVRNEINKSFCKEIEVLKHENNFEAFILTNKIFYICFRIYEL